MKWNSQVSQQQNCLKPFVQKDWGKCLHCSRTESSFCVWLFLSKKVKVRSRLQNGSISSQSFRTYFSTWLSQCVVTVENGVLSPPLSGLTRRCSREGQRTSCLLLQSSLSSLSGKQVVRSAIRAQTSRITLLVPQQRDECPDRCPWGWGNFRTFLLHFLLNSKSLTSISLICKFSITRITLLLVVF